MFKRRQIDFWRYIAPCLILWLSLNLLNPVKARVAGKGGHNVNYYSGKYVPIYFDENYIERKFINQHPSNLKY